MIDDCKKNPRCSFDILAPGSRDAGSQSGDTAALSDSGPQSDLAPDRPPDGSGDGASDRPPESGASCPAGDTSLRLCLRFENTMVDESEPPATLTASNATYELGASEQALRLGGSSLLRADSGWGGALDLDFTLEAWIRPERLPVDPQRFGVFDEETHFGVFVLPDGGVRCTSSGATVTAPNAVATGQWAAISCAASGNTLVLWVDGVQKGQAQMDGNANGATFILAIGGNLPSGDPFEGLIDNVRVWSRARTPAEICAYAPRCLAP